MNINRANFLPGDLIAVFGGEDSKDGKISEDVFICKVLYVGSNDVIVEETRQSKFSSRSTSYIVPQSICCKLDMNPEVVTTSSILIPEIGDLVISYARDAYKTDNPIEATGILYKIVYKFGKPTLATLLVGTDMKEFLYSTLMVLQRN